MELAMMRMRIDDGGEYVTTTIEVVLDQIWVRARSMVVDLDLRVVLGRERREPGHRRRR